jgi:hypothetical protein
LPRAFEAVFDWGLAMSGANMPTSVARSAAVGGSPRVSCAAPPARGGNRAADCFGDLQYPGGWRQLDAESRQSQVARRRSIRGSGGDQTILDTLHYLGRSGGRRAGLSVHAADRDPDWR